MFVDATLFVALQALLKKFYVTGTPNVPMLEEGEYVEEEAQMNNTHLVSVWSAKARALC